MFWWRRLDGWCGLTSMIWHRKITASSCKMTSAYKRRTWVGRKRMCYLLGSLLWHSLVISSGDWMGIIKAGSKQCAVPSTILQFQGYNVSPRATSRNSPISSMKMSPQCHRLSLTFFSRWVVYCMHVCVRMCVDACVCTYVCVCTCIYMWKCEVWSPCFVPHLGMDFIT